MVALERPRRAVLGHSLFVRIQVQMAGLPDDIGATDFGRQFLMAAHGIRQKKGERVGNFRYAPRLGRGGEADQPRRGAKPVAKRYVQRAGRIGQHRSRAEEHTSELQSLLRISAAVFCLNKKKNNKLTLK